MKLIGNPKVMRMATKHGLPHPVLMKFVLKLLANLTDPGRRRDGPDHQRPDQGGTEGVIEEPLSASMSAAGPGNLVATRARWRPPAPWAAPASRP